MTHDFRDSLDFSHAASDWAGWEPLYRQAFPTFAAMIDHRQNGDHQKAGIDRTVVLSTSKVIRIDEKVRAKPYPDVFLETVSKRRPGRRDEPGWVVKPLLAHYIAYLVAPLGKAYLLPVEQMQSAWARHGASWSVNKQGKSRVIEVRNECRGERWTTLGVPVPVDVLFRAIGECLRLSFTPFGQEAA